MDIGLGFDFQKSTDSGATFTTIAKIMDADLPGIKADKNEASYTTQGDNAKRFRKGLVDGGEFKAKFIFEHGPFAAILTELNTDLTTGFVYKIVFTDTSGGTGSTATFSGFFSGLEGGFSDVGAGIICSMTVQISGQVTFASGTGS